MVLRAIAALAVSLLNSKTEKKISVKADFQSSHEAPRSSLRVLASN